MTKIKLKPSKKTLGVLLDLFIVPGGITSRASKSEFTKNAREKSPEGQVLNRLVYTITGGLDTGKLLGEMYLIHELTDKIKDYF